MNKAEKRAFWRQHLADWLSSGTSQKDYCEQHQLKPANFCYWRKQLNTSPTSESKLIPVTVPSRNPSIRLMASGVQIEIPLDMLEQVLPVVWRTLQEAR